MVEPQTVQGFFFFFFCTWKISWKPFPGLRGMIWIFHPLTAELNSVSRFSLHGWMIYFQFSLKLWLLTKISVCKDIKWQLFRLLPVPKTPVNPLTSARIWAFFLYKKFTHTCHKSYWLVKHWKYETNGMEYRKHKHYSITSLRYAGFNVKFKIINKKLEKLIRGQDFRKNSGSSWN